MPCRLLLLLLLLLLAAPALADGDESEKEEDDWTVHWANGLKIDSPDGDFQIVIGGRIHADTTFNSTDDELLQIYKEIKDGSELRRARLFVGGLLYQAVEFKAELEFAGGDVAPKDVYVGLKDTPVGGIRLGHFKEPFTLEEYTSDNYVTFVERSVNTIFAPSYNYGLLFHDHVGKRLTWAIGGFRDTDNAGNVDSDSAAVTARLTGLPIYADGGRRLLHLGISASTRDPGQVLAFNARPEVHLAPRFVDTGDLKVDRLDLLDLELALVSGSFWAATEWTSAELHDVTADDRHADRVSFSGGNVRIGYFLTGERRPYKTSSGVFDRVRPKSNFTGRKGKGAWEIAARYSTLDLDDESVAGGTINNYTLAVNWYLNSATRLMFNVVDSRREKVGDAKFFLARVQVDF